MRQQYWLPKTITVLVIFGVVCAVVWEVLPAAREMIRLAGAHDGRFRQVNSSEPSLASELAKAQQHIGQQKFAEAEAILRRAVDDYPQTARVHSNRGRTATEFTVYPRTRIFS